VDIVTTQPASRVQPQAIIGTDPLGIGREYGYVLLAPGETLAAYFDRAGIDIARPVVVRLNGARVPRGMWARTRPHTGQLIEVQAVAHGGSGRSGTKIVAGVILAAIGAVSGQAFLLNFGVGIALAGVSSLLTRTPQLRQFRSEQTSPTYSLTGASNSARAYEPLPMVLGTHRIVPDYGAAPYTEFEGDDQYLYCTFHFGLICHGLQVYDLKIGDTSINEYQGVTLQWSGDDGALTLARSNVDTIAGGSLTNAGGPVTRTSSEDTVELAVDIEGYLFRQGDNNIEPRSVTLIGEYRPVGSVTWLPFFTSGFATATEYWSEGYYDGSNWVQYSFDPSVSAQHVDGAFSRTLTTYVGGDSGGYVISTDLYWRRVTYSEAAAAQYQTPSSYYPSGNASAQVIEHGSTKPLRLTYRRSVAQGQYQVRLFRSSADETDSRVTSQIAWSVLRSYQADTASYSGQRRLAVKIKASGQLQGTLDNLSATARRVIPVRDAVGNWSLPESGGSNPAWLFAFVARGWRQGGRLVWGAGLSDAQIDFESLYAWAQFCASANLTFSGVIDTSATVGEMLTTICSAGRGSYTFTGGRLGVVWDAPNLPISGVVGMGNIVAGSFSVQYVTERPYDEVVVAFLNAANGYAQEEVRVTVPGVTAPRKTQRVELLGVTSRDQAGRAANLAVAALVYRKKIVSWTMDIEGTLLRRGDVVAISHDMTQWGYAGRLVALTGDGLANTTTLTLDRRVPFNSSVPGDTWIGVRAPGESSYRVMRVSVVGVGADVDNNVVTLVQDWPPSVPLPGTTHPAVDYLYIYDFDPTPGARYKVLSRVPRVTSDGGVQVEFQAVPDPAQYYAAEGGTYDVVAPDTLLDATASIGNLTVTEQVIVSQGIETIELTATWSANTQYATAKVWGVVGGDTVQIGSVDGGRRRISWTARHGEVWTIYVQPFNALGQPGTVQSVQYTVGGLVTPSPGTFAVAVAANGTRIYSWTLLGDTWPRTLRGVRIRYGLGTGLLWGAMQPLDTDGGAYRVSPVHSLFPGPSGHYTFALRAEDTDGNLSATVLYTELTIAYGALLDDTSIYGFKSLFQNAYTGASALALVDNGKAHVKTDATRVDVPANLPVGMLSTIINDNDSGAWMQIAFESSVAVVQGRSDTDGLNTWYLAPMQMLSLTKLRQNVWLISGRVLAAAP
jgi:sulfur carrier protein ThiS